MSNENVTPSLNLEKCTVILLDVAGTTTSHSFVKDTLLSFVSKQAGDYLKANWEDSSVKEAVKTLKDDSLDLAAASAIVIELSEKNDNNVGLKAIQGLIYKSGYESGDLKAHVFSEVPSCLESWAKTRKVAIFSTGSIESQKLLFSHTTEGDISAHISEYFDQSIGQKTEVTSYEKIAKEMGVKTEEILFVTDLIAEAKAAKSAGLMTAVVNREGNEEMPEDAAKEYSVISSFNDIVFEKAVKRKNEESAATEEQPPSKVAKTEVVKPVEEKTTQEKPVQETKQAEKSAEVESSVEQVEDEAMEVDAQEKSEEKVDEPTVSKKAVEAAKEIVPESSATPAAAIEIVKPTESVSAPEKTEEKSAQSKTEEKSEKQETEVKAESKMECDDHVEKTEEKSIVEKIEDKTEKNECEEKDQVKPKEENLKAVETKEERETSVVDEKTCDKSEESKLETTEEDKASDKKEETIEATSEPTDKKLDSQKETKPEDTKIDESTSVAKVVESKPMVEENKPDAAKVEEPKTEALVEETTSETVKVDETKPEKSEIVAEVSKPVTEVNKKTPAENGTEKSENGTEEVENGTSAEETKVVGKENKSEMANGIEKETTNGVSEGVQQNGDKTEESSSSKVEEIKMKKIEEPSAESAPPVSVEV